MTACDFTDVHSFVDATLVGHETVPIHVLFRWASTNPDHIGMDVLIGESLSPATDKAGRQVPWSIPVYVLDGGIDETSVWGEVTARPVDDEVEIELVAIHPGQSTAWLRVDRQELVDYLARVAMARTDASIPDFVPDWLTGGAA